MYYSDIKRENGPRIIHYSDLPVAGRVAHIARTLYGSGEAVSPHTHDFAEVFWVTSGTGYQVIAGRREALHVGDARMIRPADVHSLGARLGESMSIVNVAFPPQLLRELNPRIDAPTNGGPDWELRDRRHPCRGANLSIADLAAVEAALARFACATESRIRLEILLLTLVDRIESAQPDARAAPSTGSPPFRPPAWLTAATREVAQSPELLQEGLSALVRRCGKSADHIGRVCKRTEGVTAAGLVNRLRLDRAATLLAGPTPSVTDVAFESGFANLSYFYRRFRERFGTSPRRYREAANATIRG